MTHESLRGQVRVMIVESKVLERVVARQLTNYMSDHHLHEPMQSAYKRFHSTETALLRVHNDIMWTMEKQGITILVLLDLSAAFDTIDHKVLLARMEELLGVQDIPLKWFASYLSGRTQRLHINNHFSHLVSCCLVFHKVQSLAPCCF